MKRVSCAFAEVRAIVNSGSFDDCEMPARVAFERRELASRQRDKQNLRVAPVAADDLASAWRRRLRACRYRSGVERRENAEGAREAFHAHPVVAH
jgi:hypothetical protein